MEEEVTMNDPQEGPAVSQDGVQEEAEVRWRKKDASDGEASQEAEAALTGVSWEERLREEQARAEQYLTNWQRAQADLANVRRRSQQDREEYVKRANEELIRDLLPVLDSFDRALASVPADVRGTTWADGIIAVERQLRMGLLRHGVTPIEAQGQKFDPTQHEAITLKESAEHNDDEITAELQRGYKLHDRVIRPTLVEVARNSGQPSAVSDQADH
jgi:molecular chaperone GrpE